jgi:23S rRNA U2552 (ribose-2'-O)-methylase RlmE/FtsJ
LKDGGVALIKVCQGSGRKESEVGAGRRFGKVAAMKPDLSGPYVPATYLLAAQFRLV